MQINLGTLYNRLQNLVNKDQSGRVYTIDNLNNDLPYVLYKFLDQRYGLPENPNPSVIYEISQKITDDIIELKKWMGDGENPLMVINSQGKATLPADYWHPASIFYTLIENTCNGEAKERNVVVPILTETQRAKVVSSSIMFPTRKNPACALYDGYIQFYPKDLGAVNFVYLRKPESPFFDYDIIDDEEVFLPQGQVHVNSSVMPAGTPSRTVELPLPDDCYESVINIMLADYGLRIQEQLALQVGENRKNTGF